MTRKSNESIHHSAIHWDDIHHRMETLQAATRQGWEPTQEEKKKIFQERARLLAQSPENPSIQEERLKVLEFLLANETYALETRYVQEVYPLRTYTFLPGLPSFVLGIINVRGEILSVIDLKKFFGLPEKGLSELNKVIIVQNKSMEFGILSDVILGITEIPVPAILPAPSTLTGIHSDYLRGVTPDRRIILDIERILSDPKIRIHEEIKE